MIFISVSIWSAIVFASRAELQMVNSSPAMRPFMFVHLKDSEIMALQALSSGLGSVKKAACHPQVLRVLQVLRVGWSCHSIHDD